MKRLIFSTLILILVAITGCQQETAAERRARIEQERIARIKKEKRIQTLKNVCGVMGVLIIVGAGVGIYVWVRIDSKRQREAHAPVPATTATLAGFRPLENSGQAEQSADGAFRAQKPTTSAGDVTTGQRLHGRPGRGVHLVGTTTEPAVDWVTGKRLRH